MTAKGLGTFNVVCIILWVLTMPWVWITTSGISIAAFVLFLVLIICNVTGVTASVLGVKP